MQWLIEPGIKCNVLTLQWPKNVKPLELPNFETQARTLRYRALGTACKEYGIQSLLLGHHADDQAETVLMRLANGQRGLGLQGMKPSGEIPECWGMYDVHLSGAFERGKPADWKRIRQYNRRKAKKTTSVREDDQEMEVEIEAGGVKIYRPLLGFSKDQLIATCQAKKIHWVEDHTNHDPTQTPRNAIRHLLESSSLPPALRKESLVNLSIKMQRKTEFRTKRVEDLFHACEIIDFRTRSGSLTIRFPKNLLAHSSTDPLVRIRQVDRASYTAAALIKRVLEIVTPQETVPIRDLSSAVRAIFPDLDPAALDSSAASIKPAPTPFAIASVYCQPLPHPLSHSPGSHPTPQENPAPPLDPHHAWRLSRQPHILHLNSGTRLPTCSFPPALRVPVGVIPAWSEWQLYDGRFWIRVWNTTTDTLVVRPFAEEEFKLFRMALHAQTTMKFDERIAEEAPGGVRWTLPVLAREAETGADGSAKRNGEMVAAVSLGIGVWELEGKVRWEVRFRAVDWGARAMWFWKPKGRREEEMERRGMKPKWKKVFRRVELLDRGGGMESEKEGGGKELDGSVEGEKAGEGKSSMAR